MLQRLCYVVAEATAPSVWSDVHRRWSFLCHGRPEPPLGAGHSIISEKSFPCQGEGTILTHMVPDLATWQIRVGGVLLFGASERPLNDPGVDLDDPMVPMPKDGAHRDGQILLFYVK